MAEPEEPWGPSSIDAVVEALRANLDVTLLEKNLRLTPTERLEQAMAVQRLADELKRAGEALRRP